MKQKELDKLLNAGLKESGKVEGWKFSRGFLFKASKPLFFSLIVCAPAKQARLSYTLAFKHLEFDEMFWRICRLEENREQPLSFRASGAWVAPMMQVVSGEFPIEEWGVERITNKINSMLEHSRREVERLMREINGLDDNLRVIEGLYACLMEKYPDAAVNIWRERLLTALIKQEYDQAESIARERISMHDTGGFSSGKQSFYQLTIEYLRTI